MIQSRFSAAMLALTLLALGGCASRTSTVTGNSVRAIVASQIVTPQPPAAGAGRGDAATAVAAYANYQQSYVTPVPQGDSPAFGK
jgi:hypothetical protein